MIGDKAIRDLAWKQRNAKTLLRNGGIGRAFFIGTTLVQGFLVSAVVLFVGALFRPVGLVVAAVILATIWGPLVLALVRRATGQAGRAARARRRRR